MANPYLYFNELVFFVLGLYTVVLVVFLVIRRRQVRRDVENRGLDNDDVRDPLNDATCSFELRTRFEEVTQSAWYGMKFLLAFYRLVMLVFFVGFAVILSSIQYNYGVYFFTNWNALLVTLYFFLAFVASCVNIAVVNFSSRAPEIRAGGYVFWYSLQLLTT